VASNAAPVSAVQPLGTGDAAGWKFTFATGVTAARAGEAGTRVASGNNSAATTVQIRRCMTTTWHAGTPPGLSHIRRRDRYVNPPPNHSDSTG
jgi:hypothetical protein